jgi:hypothetical protein
MVRSVMVRSVMVRNVMVRNVMVRNVMVRNVMVRSWRMKGAALEQRPPDLRGRHGRSLGQTYCGSSR